MKELVQLNLKNNEKKALLELKKVLLINFPVAEIILYGSKPEVILIKNLI